jgi:excinuclease ABC subunit C
VISPDRLKLVPTRPGVYLFKDEAGRVLYVGKSASLRNRVRSYFNAGGQRAWTYNMTARAADVDWIVTDTEIEALILESNLVKQYQPRFNIRLRDDKQFPYICITVQEPFPRIFRVRRTRKDGSRYFGPYANSGDLNETLSLLKKLFPYRSCDIAIPDEALSPEPVLDRPCLEYHIKRCTAPCVRYVTRAEYRETIDQVLLFLEGKHDQVLTTLRSRMRAYAAELNFEGAAHVRDQIQSVERSVEKQKITTVAGGEYDVIGIAAEGRDASAQVFQIRAGRIVDRQHFLLDNPAEDVQDEVLSAFLKQFYERATHVPRRVIVPLEPQDREVMSEWLSGLRGGPVDLLVPRRGEKLKLVEMVAGNARDVLEQSKQKWMSDKEKTSIALAELQAALKLPSTPARIECFDISTIQGTSTVAAMVVFEEGKPKSSEYRRFKIQTPGGPDDFAAMREVITRRYRRSGSAALFHGGSMNGGTTEGNGNQTPPATEAGGAGPGAIDAARESRGLSHNMAASGGSADPSDPAPQPGAAGNGAAKDESWRKRPDLVVIDGGKGQLAAALESVEALGMQGLAIVSLAKRQEEVFVPGRQSSLLLPRDSEGLYLLQRIRDEAHRFAVTYHRQVRSRQARSSALDGFRGIGPVRRRALIKAFGSLRGVREATVEEIAAVPGINANMAASLKHYLAE